MDKGFSLKLVWNKNTPSASAPDASIGQLGATDAGLMTSPWTPYSRKSWNAPFQSAGCIIFDYPFFECLLTYCPESSRRWIARFMKDIPEWADPLYRLAKGERNMNAWNTLKFLAYTSRDKAYVRGLYERCFVSTFTKDDCPPDYKWDSIEMGGFLNGNWLYGSNALPEVIAQNDPLWLAEWDRAKIVSGEYDRERREARISLISAAPGHLTVVSLVAPDAVVVNGVKTAVTREGDKLLIPFGVGGAELRITLPDYRLSDLKFPDFAAQALGECLTLSKCPAPASDPRGRLGGDLKVGKCESVDLGAFCNMGFADEKADDQKGGTDDTGSIWLFPKGRTVVRGVPFTFVDPDKNGGKSCVVLKGKAKAFFPSEVKGIPVGKRFKRLFFLHGMGYENGSGVEVMTYRLRFEGGQSRELKITTDQNIGEWKLPPGERRLADLPEARGGECYPPGKTTQWGDGAGGYVFEWKNDVMAPGITNQDADQRGLAKLESIDIVSTGKAVPLVFAITGE